MIAGRFSQCQFIHSFIRRLKFAENKRNNVVFYTSSVKVDSCAIPKSANSNRLFSTDQDGISKLKMAAAAKPADVKYENSLAKEKSPYLLQHARNPVQWYPWGEEAFKKAKQEDKLIFLSVGYSTCHWCHVMERESFENEAVAEIMNKHFINIKVDREERPDVDKVYMTFVQASSGSGGWPMSVFLTPDLKPVAGGTYFPPEDNWGRPGFKSILLNMAKQWKDDKIKLSNTGSKIADLLQKTMIFDVEMAESLISGQVPKPECWERCVKQLTNHYEPVYGGFGLAPKFPQPSNLMFAFHAYARQPNSPKYEEIKKMCLHTLTMMAKGGIHDHVAQGFARYSTDERWHVPHFEKMLYDQGQLTVVYCYAYLVTKDEMYADIVHDILTYVSRDLSHPEGGFYSAEDADSYPTADATEKREGAFCVWAYERVQELLRQPVSSKPEVNLADVFCHHYGVRPEGNVDPHQDPHHELTNQNVLIVNGSEDATAAKFGLDKQNLKEELGIGRQKLYEARQKRPRPHLDNKIITSWNGLMISGYARASETLNNNSYTKRAVQAAEFIQKYLYKKDEKILLRSCYTGENNEVTQISHPIHGFLDDYAFLIRGLLDLYEACFDPQWLEWAEELQEKQDELFWDIASAGYFSMPSSDELLLRLKEGLTNCCWPYFSCYDGWSSLYTSLRSIKIPSPVSYPKHSKTPTVLHHSTPVQSVGDQDGAEPSGNSIAAQNLLRLSAMLERSELRDKAGQLLASFTGRLTQMPVTLPELTSALMLYHDSPTLIVITGKTSDADTAAMLSVVRSRLLAGRVLMLADGDTTSIVYRKSETVSKMKPEAGHQNAYVCRRHTCTLPVHTAADLASLLDQLHK